MSELHGLQSRIADFTAAGTRVLAVSPDSVEENRRVAKNLGLGFLILSDADLAVTKALGLLHEGAAMDGSDVPRPATFIIERGVIRWRDLTDNWRVRVRASEVLEAVKASTGA